MLVEERHHPVVEQVGGGDRGLAVVELGEGHLGVGVDEGLLVDPPDALQRADIEGVLGPAIARALALELAVRLLVGLGLLQRGDLRLGQQDQPSCATLASSALSRCFMGQVVALPHAAHAGGRDRQTAAACSSSLETRTWPQAGCSIASATTASSIVRRRRGSSGSACGG